MRIAMMTNNYKPFVGGSARTTALLYDEKSIANQILESYAYLKKSYEAEHWLMMHLNRTSYPVLAKEY